MSALATAGRSGRRCGITTSPRAVSDVDRRIWARRSLSSTVPKLGWSADVAVQQCLAGWKGGRAHPGMTPALYPRTVLLCVCVSVCVSWCVFSLYFCLFYAMCVPICLCLLVYSGVCIHGVFNWVCLAHWHHPRHNVFAYWTSTTSGCLGSISRLAGSELKKPLSKEEVALHLTNLLGMEWFAAPKVPHDGCAPGRRASSTRARAHGGLRCGPCHVCGHPACAPPLHAGAYRIAGVAAIRPLFEEHTMPEPVEVPPFASIILFSSSTRRQSSCHEDSTVVATTGHGSASC